MCIRDSFTPDAADDLVYYYTRAENAPYADNFAAGASTGVQIGGEESALAASGQAEVDAILADVPEELHMPPERLSFFLSCLRQAMEQELVQLRIASPNPKLAQTDETCTRHVDLLLENHPLADSKALHPFREWCIQTAKGPILRRLLKELSFELPKRRGYGKW